MNDSRVTAIGCTFTRLSAAGAVAINSADFNSGNVFTAVDCTFTENSNLWGTICTEQNVDPTINLTNCTFTNNSVPMSSHPKDTMAGAVAFVWWAKSGSMTVDRCTFSANSGPHLFGITYLPVTYANCLFTGNTTESGMVFHFRSSMAVVNCTFADNPEAAGVLGTSQAGTRPVYAANSIFASEEGAATVLVHDSPSWRPADAEAITLTNCMVFNMPLGKGVHPNSTNVMEADPLFEDAGTGDYQLTKISPAIDAGDNTFVPGYLSGGEPVDIKGYPRIVDGDGDTELQVPPEGGEPLETEASVDLGCYEKQKPYLPGDANDDCKVNILDLIYIRNRLNQDVGTGDNWKADVTGDGKINILDLIFARNHLNTTCED